jgi:hypothetical protein
MVDPSLEETYIDILERSDDVLVVWGPGKLNPFFPELDHAVLRWYCPVARFGAIEVWRHRYAPRSRSFDDGRSAGGR